MQIDWFTFVAQIVNFLVLIWLLKRFLYGPILKAMDDRQAGIAATIEEARTSEKNAETTQRDFEQKLAELSNTRNTLLTEAQQQADSWRDERLNQARDEVSQARNEWHGALRREKHQLLQSLQLEVARHTADATRHLLNQLAGEDLQPALVRGFVNQLTNASNELCATLNRAGTATSIVVESSHSLSESDRNAIELAIHRITEHSAAFEFKTNPDLVCGIELHTQGCRLAWSAREAVAELESQLIDAVDHAVPATNDSPNPESTHTNAPQSSVEQIVQ